jgi:Sulfotransferase family
LPRSGTSILGRNIARMENCTGLHDTGVIEDEGRFLQDVYPTEGDCGGPGRFGFDPRAHLTENSPLLTPENALKLRQCWEQYWDQSKAIRVEKTPANLLMTRFLQAAFPNAYFVVIKRHPVPVSIAIQKWKVSITSLHNLFEHWLRCYELFEEDKKYLKRVYELTYEDYIQDPDQYHQEIAAFIGTRVPGSPVRDRFRYVAQWRNRRGLRVPEDSMEVLTGSHNEKYFKRWYHLLMKSPLKGYYRYVATKYEPRFAKYGCSLVTALGTREESLHAGAGISSLVGPMYCLGVDIHAFLWRSALRLKWRTKEIIKAALPAPLLNKITRGRQVAVFSKERSKVVTP